MSKTISFNGGKMYHVFTTKRLENNKLIYLPEWFNLEAKEALYYGRIFHKIDGANGLIVVEPDGERKLYQRYDGQEGGTQTTIPLPPGANLVTYSTLNSKGREVSHHYCYKLIPRDLTGKQGRINNQLYAQLDQLTSLESGKQYTVELIGKKFQQTPGVEAEATFCLHQDQEIDRSTLDSELNDLDQVQHYLRKVIVEGLVVQHPVTGCYYKIRSNLMPDQNCPFEKLKKNKTTDHNLIKPVFR